MAMYVYLFCLMANAYALCMQYAPHSSLFTIVFLQFVCSFVQSTNFITIGGHLDELIAFLATCHVSVHHLNLLYSCYYDK